MLVDYDSIVNHYEEKFIFKLRMGISFAEFDSLFPFERDIYAIVYEKFMEREKETIDKSSGLGGRDIFEQKF